MFGTGICHAETKLTWEHFGQHIPSGKGVVLMSSERTNEGRNDPTFPYNHFTIFYVFDESHKFLPASLMMLEIEWEIVFPRREYILCEKMVLWWKRIIQCRTEWSMSLGIPPGSEEFWWGGVKRTNLRNERLLFMYSQHIIILSIYLMTMLYNRNLNIPPPDGLSFLSFPPRSRKTENVHYWPFECGSSWSRNTNIMDNNRKYVVIQPASRPASQSLNNQPLIQYETQCQWWVLCGLDYRFAVRPRLQRMKWNETKSEIINWYEFHYVLCVWFVYGIELAQPYNATHL